jgi:hypothetical protein
MEKMWNEQTGSIAAPNCWCKLSLFCTSNYSHLFISYHILGALFVEICTAVSSMLHRHETWVTCGPLNPVVLAMDVGTGKCRNVTGWLLITHINHLSPAAPFLKGCGIPFFCWSHV